MNEGSFIKPETRDGILASRTKLVLFGGKGGVGKTTNAAASALRMARSGTKVLLVSSDPAPSLSDIFRTGIGGEITRIRANLDAVEIDAGQFAGRFRAHYGDMLYNVLSSVIPVKKSDLDLMPDEVAPGFDELLAIEYIISLLPEGYDTIVWDTAPTGHTLRLLHLPRVIERYAGAGMKLHSRIAGTLDTIRTWFDRDTSGDALRDALLDLSGSAELISAILSQEWRTEFIPVVIPESLALSETGRLIRVLDEHGIRVAHMIINGVVPESECPFCSSRRRMQQRYIDELHRSYDGRIRIIEAPLFPGEVIGIEKLEEYSEQVHEDEIR